jgi:ABC-2 type transport system ATP-binding protein
MSYLKVKKLGKNYGNTTALNSISFDIDKKSSVALLGNNGSGKSTLIHSLCNMFKFSGEIIFNGIQITTSQHAYKRNIGFFLSIDTLIDSFTAMEYLKFVARFQGLKNPQIINEKIQKLAKYLLLEDLDKKTKEYSSGNQTKIKLIASLIHSPEMLIMDEPLRALDHASKNRVKSLLRTIQNSEKVTMLIASHDLGLSTEICDRFIVLHEGKLIFDTKRQPRSNKEEIIKLLNEQLGENPANEFEWIGG